MGTKTRRPASAAGKSAVPPVTEFPRRMRTQTPVTKDDRLFDAMLNNMSQGVVMFDSNARLIFRNQRYLEIYGLSAEVAKPGCALGDLLRHCIATGSFAGDPDEYARTLTAAIAQGKTTSDVKYELAFAGHEHIAVPAGSYEVAVIKFKSMPASGDGAVTEGEWAFAQSLGFTAKYSSLTHAPNSTITTRIVRELIKAEP